MNTQSPFPTFIPSKALILLPVWKPRSWNVNYTRDKLFQAIKHLPVVVEQAITKMDLVYTGPGPKGEGYGFFFVTKGDPEITRQRLSHILRKTRGSDWVTFGGNAHTAIPLNEHPLIINNHELNPYRACANFAQEPLPITQKQANALLEHGAYLALDTDDEKLNRRLIHAQSPEGKGFIVIHAKEYGATLWTLVSPPIDTAVFDIPTPPTSSPMNDEPSIPTPTSIRRITAMPAPPLVHFIPVETPFDIDMDRVRQAIAEKLGVRIKDISVVWKRHLKTTFFMFGATKYHIRRLQLSTVDDFKAIPYVEFFKLIGTCSWIDEIYNLDGLSKAAKTRIVTKEEIELLHKHGFRTIEVDPTEWSNVIVRAESESGEFVGLIYLDTSTKKWAWRLLIPARGANHDKKSTHHLLCLNTIRR